MGSHYECDRCGACCKHGPVDLCELDLRREPRLGEHASLYRGPVTDGRVGYLLPAPEIGCPLLDENECCSIHATRPIACSSL
ncbi:MAG: YkgJ family cysteine cluster protein, partial [Planctomycetaceae bacterium]|nr:YkgJ family cysteine cluster protein [Planctomycetaceae bacterium]